MSISTLQTIQPTRQTKKSMGIFVYLILAILGVGIIAGVYFGIKAYNKAKGKSAITVDVGNTRAEVFINDKLIGTTPIEQMEVKPGSNKVTIRSVSRQYETTIKFLSNTDKFIHQVALFRDMGVSELFSGGRDLWFDEDTTGTMLRIISEPSGASVFIDNTEIGKTPFTSSKLSEGDYDLRLEYAGYEPQKIRFRTQKNYTSNISAKLFPMPVPSRVVLFEGSDNLFDLSSDNNQVISDTKTWVEAVVYWNQTRGINLEGIGFNKELLFDYFIDYKGTIFDKLGQVILEEKYNEFKDAKKGGYLGRVSDGQGLTEPAKEALKKFKNTQITNISQSRAKILQTGTGWLRVRSEPSVNASELAKVNVGEEFNILETMDEWVKIMVSDSMQGWVSKTFVQIITPAPVTTDGSGPSTQL